MSQGSASATPGPLEYEVGDGLGLGEHRVVAGVELHDGAGLSVALIAEDGGAVLT